MFAVIIVAFLLIITEAAIERPDKVIVRIDKFKSEVFKFQNIILSTISLIRSSILDEINYRAETSISIIESNIQKISASDLEIRFLLDKQASSSCTMKLKDFLDQIIVLSGYAISNCIEEENDASSSSSFENFASLDAITKNADELGKIILNTLIGRNVFTQGDEIISRAKEILEEQKKVLDTAVNNIDIGNIVALNNAALKKFKVCYDLAQTGVQQGLLVARNQIFTCETFGRKAGRSISALPDPLIFFPQLH